MSRYSYSRLIKSAEIYNVWVANRLRAIQNQKVVEDWHKIDVLIKSAETYKEWVANRLRAIQTRKMLEDWHKTNTTLNNISSRRAYLTEFMDSELPIIY